MIRKVHSNYSLSCESEERREGESSNDSSKENCIRIWFHLKLDKKG